MALVKSWVSRCFVTLAIAFSVACATPAGTKPSVQIQDAPRRPGLPVVLVAMPSSAVMLEVRKGLLSELEDEFDLVSLPVGDDTSPETLAAGLDRTTPKCVVLMNNKTLDLYKKLQASQPGRTYPPAVVVMSSFLEEEIKGLKNAVGISYEVPGVSAFVRLRSVLSRQVKKVGVLHRARFASFLGKQSKLAALEKFELVPQEMPASPSASDIRDGLEALTKRGVDAVWVLNDNALLGNQTLLTTGWMPGIQAGTVPVIVNVEALVDPKIRFGSFAVLPDHEALGVQTANKVFELMEADWELDEGSVDLPLSVKTILKVEEARSMFGINEGRLGEVNRLVQ